MQRVGIGGGRPQPATPSCGAYGRGVCSHWAPGEGAVLPTSQPTSPQHFVWLGGKIQVKPHQFAVIAATDDVVT